MDTQRRSIRLPAQLYSVAPATEFLRAGALEAGLPESRIQELDLVVEELVVNIARYAYSGTLDGGFEISYGRRGTGCLEVEMSDEGIAFDPAAVEAPDLNGTITERKVGGLGIFLVRSLVGSLTYRRQGERNITHFQFPPAGQ